MAAFLFAPPEPPTYSIDSLSGKLAVVGGVPCLVLEADAPAGAQICILYAHGNAVDIGQIVAMMRKIQFVLMKRAGTHHALRKGMSGGRLDDGGGAGSSLALI